MSSVALNMVSPLRRTVRRAPALPESVNGAVNGLNGHSRRRVRIWGLDAQSLHDAFWRCSGVQCVRRGRRESLDRAADLFLLLEPDQCALFDLSSIIDRLVWRGATLTRIAIIDADCEAYRESMELDEAGYVKRIARRYRHSHQNLKRVYITSNRRIAHSWMAAASPAQVRHALRKTLPTADRARCEGRCYFCDEQQQEEAMLSALVARWREPDRVIDGIHCAQPGIYKQRGDALPGIRLIGPVWVGAGHSEENACKHCIVGPAWLADREDALTGQRSSATLRAIGDIPPPDARRRSAARPNSYPAAKRAFDIVAASAALLVAWPLLVLTAVAIMLDDGLPVMFRHRRQTRGGRMFNCLKFRTMHHQAETMVEELHQRNLCDGPQVNIEDDPRVTRIGRVLRRFHLDELPQLWNVLIGDMSLVGPRPSPDRENQICPAWRELRLSVRPGITGLWQLKRTRKPGEDFQEWIRYDLEYVRRAGFWFDLSICLRTAHIIVFRRRR